MRRRAFLRVAGSGLTATAVTKLLTCETASATTSVESLVMDLERKWMDAMVRRDEAALRSLMADDFKRIEKPWPNISVFKPQWVGNAVRWYRIELFKYLNSSVRVSGNTAVLSSRYRWRGALGEVPVNEIVTAEDTWEQRNGRWQVVLQFISKTEKVGHTDKPVARRKAIKVDSVILGAYVGKYQFGPSRILTVSHEEGRLIHTGSGGHSAELLPETTSRFFRKDAGVLTTFIKKDGQVTHVVHRHTNGRESIGKRIA